MQLEAGNVDIGANGVTVNDYLQSVSNDTVFAAGDCAATGQPMLTPAANQQARTIAQNLLAGEMKHCPDYGSIPAAVYTVPSLASVGMSEIDAFEQKLDFEVRAGDMSDWGSVRKIGGSAAAYKILVDNKTDRILGAHLLGPHAAESINVFAMAIKFNLTASNVKSVLFTFPTLQRTFEQCCSGLVGRSRTDDQTRKIWRLVSSPSAWPPRNQFRWSLVSQLPSRQQCCQLAWTMLRLSPGFSTKSTGYERKNHGPSQHAT